MRREARQTGKTEGMTEMPSQQKERTVKLSGVTTPGSSKLLSESLRVGS